MSISRRSLLVSSAAVSGGALLPAFLRPARAEAGPIRIGVPTGITGNWAALGQQVQRSCRLFAKTVNAKGGINGRPVEFIYEDTQGDPAACVRKVTELVERGGVNLITGIISSPESLAVMPRLNDWNTVYVGSISGVGSMTAANFVPNAFRSCTSGPMRARTIALWLADSPKKRHFAIAQDYAWGKSSVATFEKLISDLKKELVGQVLSPLGTKDYSSFIARIREANPEVLYIAMSGDDATAFLKQAAQYRLADRMQLVTEVLDILNIKPLGDAAVGLYGVSQYNFGYDAPGNAEFVRLFTAEYNEVPDTYEGEQWQALAFLAEAIRRSNSTDAAAVRGALEGLEIDSVKGKVKMRACDHQAEQQVFIAKVEKTEQVAYPVPKIGKAYAIDAVMPGCRKDTY
ncbi:ABC transporter substrate-binding protein [Bradyrhizobium sp. SEMIA]|uniref:ABC transporter substrate-binding protein n=1 Tax=Bradyrhizobium sp. SEMIA TaxID=2597515 RepID=UPI0018A43843|nr:ABC transporter substrate-binding protein [Bradyrhizobium sp. SEMIA]QOG20857.1 ABC transporter substrate-binding protein [Bradyrhizobium sp. SEMIA]